MRGWVVAALLGAGWAATCVESRRRWVEDGKALEQAREGLAAGYAVSVECGSRLSERVAIVRASQHVGAALEARA